MDTHGISFTSLGLIILDEIRFPNQAPLIDIIGGSGAYATLGARLFLPHPHSQCIGWIIHVGNDFPESVKNRLESWGISLVVEREADKPSMRGLLEYKDTTFGPKDFKYTTPFLSVRESSLEGTRLLHSMVYHYLETPHNIAQHVSTLFDLRKKKGISEQPLIIWEPAPPSCRKENLEACLDAVLFVDVFSPNHIELAALFGESPLAIGVVDKGKIEDMAARVVNSGIGADGKGIVIVRAGEHGCLVCGRDTLPMWLPPFYKAVLGETQHFKVVDPTGAGNAFLGGYAVGYLKTESIVEAAYYGSVAASFALEQVGMPEKSGKGDGELWNGVNVSSRLDEYKSKLSYEGQKGES
ncbi:hypothetical protein ASPWEDRAFT_157025 [Aspergillus wentii DTO 134E9]|uniref:Carbohydrate kinase PfkB domain-containing protein n=1 Tax=Aspergillus wentii DTO 134E9 TaxID=1073089 RepID=A0A1L9RFU7_ASPWE|nr:uncharacterized protein ASPWEDRAFT_157025 [Aspergillus wentii DTO 134E9]KAI9925509.1 hypothetical protein MW887_005890 [Aspergillus wentii]OJJ33748.1 hypothetical protein ASPWEDRAFT_157025 [Aspergillus wentii DTO 134E9]